MKWPTVLSLQNKEALDHYPVVHFFPPKHYAAHLVNTTPNDLVFPKHELKGTCEPPSSFKTTPPTGTAGVGFKYFSGDIHKIYDFQTLEYGYASDLGVDVDADLVMAVLQTQNDVASTARNV